MKPRTALATLFLACTAAGAMAQTPPAGAASTPVVDARQAQQQGRINQGVASGELTRREARQLRHQQQHIAHAEARAKADGVVTPGERAKLDRMQDRASRNIHRQKHDAQHRPAAAASAP